jgi:hypothetical protein
MSVIDKLATSLGRRDEIPNTELAKEIAEKQDTHGIIEIIAGLDSKKIQNDCIKVLYEVGKINPSLIAEYTHTFTGLLFHKNNRLQWGAMTALYTISLEYPENIYPMLPEITKASMIGSVITKDNAVNILIVLCRHEAYASVAFRLLLSELKSCPTNQLPMYAEKAIPVINPDNKKSFTEVLTSRLGEIEKDTKRKRVEKAIKKFS